MLDCKLPGYFCSVTRIIEYVPPLSQKAGSGQWNDLDMLEVGNGGMTYDEYVTHFSMWAILKSPLILGNDVRNIDDETLSIITNEAVIALNQDPYTSVANRIWRKAVFGSEGEVSLWQGALEKYELVVVLLNTSPQDQLMDIVFKEAFMDKGRDTQTGSFEVLDLWEKNSEGKWGKSLGIMKNQMSRVKVKKHGVRVWRFVPVYSSSQHTPPITKYKMVRPLRGSHRDEFYAALDSASSKAIDGQLPSSIDSAFQLQEYISALVRADPHNVERIVKIPKRDDKDKERDESEVDEYCWIYEQLRRLALDLTYPLVTKLQECCSRQSCPEMKAGEWLYLCVAHGSGSAGVMEILLLCINHPIPMKQCCAIDYIIHTIDSATALLNSPKAFPSRISIPYQSRRHFPSLTRRLGRIFAHAYFHHREEFTAAEEQNSLYARFLALAKRFDLVPSEFLVIPLLQDGNKQSETNNENSNANVDGNGNDQHQNQSLSSSPQESTDITVPSQQSSNANTNSSPVSTGGNPNSNSPSGFISRSPRNRLRTDTMYLSGTFHEMSSGISSGPAGNGLDTSPRRVSSPLAATLASQEEEDERAELAQSQSKAAEGSPTGTGKTSEEAENAHLDQVTDTSASSSIPVIASNAPVKVLIRDFAIENPPSSESAATSASELDSTSTSEEITIPVPLSQMFVPPIVVNAPQVVITNADGLDSTSHPTFVTEVSAEDDEEENADVDDLEHALENDDSEEDADDGDDEEEEEDEHEAITSANMELPESDITGAAAIEVRFEEIAPEREPEEEEEEEQHETEHAKEPDSFPAISALNDTPSEPPAESNPIASRQDPDTALHDLSMSIDDSVAEVDAYLVESESQDEENDNPEQTTAVASSTSSVSDDDKEDVERVETQHSEDLPAEDIDNSAQSQSQAPNDASALDQLASKPSIAASADSAFEQTSTIGAEQKPEEGLEPKAPETVSADPSISDTNSGEEEK
ncbi:hypothetical protein Clacol_002338 [Clathrus columnatus]|uniref:Alpha-galactosidase n=1 Tax=Clathrus columnatus TaxID=1419009 RepID=A0AAV5A1J6_9AGAM|nr:hypothetical protein Clacol_002338 [Clathrus columnatus]